MSAEQLEADRVERIRLQRVSYEAYQAFDRAVEEERKAKAALQAAVESGEGVEAAEEKLKGATYMRKLAGRAMTTAAGIELHFEWIREEPVDARCRYFRGLPPLGRANEV